jgi:hypothetical protein
MAGLCTKSPSQKNARAQKWDEPVVRPIEKFAKSKHCDCSIFLNAHSMWNAQMSLRLQPKFAKLGRFAATACTHRDFTHAQQPGYCDCHACPALINRMTLPAKLI